MKLPLTGGCQCGAARFAISAEPLTVYACHCTSCQRQSGGGFGLSAFFPRAAITQTGAAPAQWRRRSGGGRMQTCLFCGSCGSRLFHLPDEGGLAVLKPGTLDDSAWVRPIAHIWVRHAQPWMIFPPDVLTYDGQPTDFPLLFEAWRRLRAGLPLDAGLLT